MANELQVKVSITFRETGQVYGGTEFNVTQTGTRQSHQRQSVGTSEEAMQLGEVAGATLGWCWFRNLDATNFVQIKNATSGVLVQKIGPGQQVLFRFGSGVTAPFVIADTLACLCEFIVFEV